MASLFYEKLFSGNPNSTNQFIYILHRILYNQLGINPINLLGVIK
ncbi:hypothetical protein GCM10009001_03560 [Virgibacillus siamensis]|uniref:Uncharacterized protein n=1 Tax=Virgibacillus siamensis TaxID=480071 RepID=A0ABN1FHF3_9BACI